MKNLIQKKNHPFFSLLIEIFVLSAQWVMLGAVFNNAYYNEGLRWIKVVKNPLNLLICNFDRILITLLTKASWGLEMTQKSDIMEVKTVKTTKSDINDKVEKSVKKYHDLEPNGIGHNSG